ncbi:unnamed protein product [Closterium sp. Naga37s-1]|nr:unnamed protein product [Closterium sp. Naga37s-1]
MPLLSLRTMACSQTLQSSPGAEPHADELVNGPAVHGAAVHGAAPVDGLHKIAAVDGAGAGGGGAAEEEDPFDSFPDPHEFADDGMFPDPPEFADNGMFPDPPEFADNGMFPDPPEFADNGMFPDPPEFADNGMFPDPPETLQRPSRDPPEVGMNEGVGGKLGLGLGRQVHSTAACRAVWLALGPQPPSVGPPPAHQELSPMLVSS